jgi:hypothetical protein
MLDEIAGQAILKVPQSSELCARWSDEKLRTGGGSLLRIEKAQVIRLGFRDQQDAVDELEQMRTAGENLLDAGRLGASERVPFQHLRETKHVIQGRAQLVAGA